MQPSQRRSTLISATIYIAIGALLRATVLEANASTEECSLRATGKLIEIRQVDGPSGAERPTEWTQKIIVVPVDIGVDLEDDGGHIATFVPEDDR